MMRSHITRCSGVRSDSVQFLFPAACRDHDHLYHGTPVNNQVPPL
jgi:hypothetical protein